MGTKTGTVKFFRDQYGFITPDEGGGDVFVHYSDITGDGYKSLSNGDRVTYTPAQNGNKGIKAVDVRVLRDAPDHVPAAWFWLIKENGRYE